jgi:hypothetical protein
MLKRLIFFIFKAKIRNVQQSLGKFENYFKQLKRKSCGFDFNNEMSHVLGSDQVVRKLLLNFFLIQIKTTIIVLEIEY